MNKRYRCFTITGADVGRRLDRVLREWMPEISLARLGKLIRARRIRVNDVKTRPQQRLADQDVVKVFAAEASEHWTRQARERMNSPAAMFCEAIEFGVLYEDEHILAVAKPPGLLVHGRSHCDANEPTLIGQVLAYFAQDPEAISADDTVSLSEFVQPTPKFQPALAHRIDRDTSGVVLVAKTAEAMQKLSRMLKRRLMEKHYLGLVRGDMPDFEGVIEAPIVRRDRTRARKARHRVDVDSVHAAAKLATTKYRVLASQGDYRIVEFELVTGRTHQIRAHLRHVGVDLIGDRDYGDPKLNELARDALQARRQFLHAASVKFEHPMTGAPLVIVAPLPVDLRTTLALAGFTARDLPEDWQVVLAEPPRPACEHGPGSGPIG